ncbi:hypothetical protein ACFQ4O_04755 [Methylopila musalis]|uniref:Uncharacterized protein n=1 Tax=Methylopila musalis TaxID=1134781 RepID=A0ABW3Z513_9HYPH
MTERSHRFDRFRDWRDYSVPAGMVASWGAGVWLVVNLVDVARLLSH